MSERDSERCPNCGAEVGPNAELWAEVDRKRYRKALERARAIAVMWANRNEDANAIVVEETTP